MGARSDELIADLHHTVQAVAEERRDAQHTRELVRHARRRGAHGDVLRPKDQEALRADGQAVRSAAPDRAAKRAQATRDQLAGDEGGLADEVRDEARCWT